MQWTRSENASRTGFGQPLPAPSQGSNALPALRFVPSNDSNSHLPIPQQSPHQRHSFQSQIQAPSLPSWAKAQQTVTQQSHQTSLPVLPRSPIKQQLGQETEDKFQDEGFSRPVRSPSVASQTSQIRVLLKSSPLKPSHYKMVDDNPEPPALSYTQAEPLRQSRKRPEPGAMGVRNMMSAALTGGSVNTPSGTDSATRASSNDGRTTGTSTPTEHINKRGRPKGWKPGMSYAAIRGNTPAKPYVPKSKTSSSGVSGGTAKRGRKAGAGMGMSNTLTDIMRKQYARANPAFTPFICEWVDECTGKRCPAELHNWETLKRHVFILHVVDVNSPGSDESDSDSASSSTSSSSSKKDNTDKEQPLQICRWGSCALNQDPKTFPSEDLLDDHLEAHLVGVAWHMGDGPRNRVPASTKLATIASTSAGSITEQDNPVVHTSTTREPAYLFSASTGEQVTPSIKDQVLETEKARQERRRRLKLLAELCNENAPDEEEYLKQTLGDGGSDL